MNPSFRTYTCAVCGSCPDCGVTKADFTLVAA